MTHPWPDAEPPALPPRATFDAWLAEMPYALEGFTALGMPDHDAGASRRDVLEHLEAVALARYPDRRALAAEPGPWVDGAVRYVGETFRRAFGGRWAYSTDPSDAVAGRPFVALDSAPGVSFSPFHALAMAVSSRDGQVLTSTWDAQARGAHHPASEPEADDDPALAGFVAGLANAIDTWAGGLAAPAQRWDGSFGSIQELARAVAAHGLPAGDAGDDPFLWGASCYLGRTLHQLYGGAWERGLGERDPMSPYAGRFYLARIDRDGERVSVSPEFLVEVTAEERDASVLTDGVRAYAP